MDLINVKKEDDTLVVGLKGHIDSNNASNVEAEINQAIEENSPKDLIIDAKELQYISSAGLRVILRLKKLFPNLKIVEVSSEIYEVFEITGFSEMMDIVKAYREISVEGCEVIGQGANGKVYRIDRDTIVKEYFNKDALPDIQRERELARTALILGIPTAIPYDVVKVGEGYGSVFELLNAQSFANLLIKDPSKIDEVVSMSVDLLKKIHGTEVKPGTMPEMKVVARDWIEFLKDYIDEDKYTKFAKMVDDIPDVHTMLHGDFHIKNVMLQDNEVLLIDMDTLCVGHPIFEFASIYNAYQGYSIVDKDCVKNFLGIDFEVGKELWDKTLSQYFNDRTPEEVKQIEDKAKLLGFARIMRRTIRRKGFESEEGKTLIETSKKNIYELLDRVDSLTY